MRRGSSHSFGTVARPAGMRQAVAGRGGYAGSIWRIGRKRRWWTDPRARI